MATLTLPDDLRASLSDRAAAEGVSSVEEYVRLLAERDRESGSPFDELADDEAQLRARLVALIQEGLDSGPAEPVGLEFWASLRAKARGPSAEGAA